MPPMIHYTYLYTFPFTLTIKILITSKRPINAPLPFVLCKLQTPSFVLHLGPQVTSVTLPDLQGQPSLNRIHESDKIAFGLIPMSWSVDAKMEKLDDGLSMDSVMPLGIKCFGRWSVKEEEDGHGGECVVTDTVTVTTFAPLAVFLAWTLKGTHVAIFDRLCEVLEKPHVE